MTSPGAPLPKTIMFRRGLSSMLAKTDMVLEAGEPCYERDTRRFKIGDGATRWSNLPYFQPTAPLPANTTITEQVLYDYITAQVRAHAISDKPHTAYDDGPSLLLLYQNAKV